MAEEVFVEFGGKKFDLVKTGRAQARQVYWITRWLSKYGVAALRNISESGTQLNTEQGLEFLGKLMENLNEDALIDLFVAATGCEKEEAEVYFDIAILVDAVIKIWDNQPSIRKLIERFFSSTKSTPPVEESSTTSE